MTELYNPQDREHALQRLDTWLESAAIQESCDEAMEYFLSPTLDLVEDQDDLVRALEQEEMQNLISGWLYADTQLGEQDCAARELLNLPVSATFSPGCQRFLNSLSRSKLSLYEVRDVVEGYPNSIFDLIYQTPHAVFPPLEERPENAPTFAVGDVVAARLMPFTDVDYRFENLLPLPGSVADAEAWISETVEMLSDGDDPMPPLDLTDAEDALALCKLLPPFAAAWWFSSQSS